MPATVGGGDATEAEGEDGPPKKRMRGKAEPKQRANAEGTLGTSSPSRPRGNIEGAAAFSMFDSMFAQEAED